MLVRNTESYSTLDDDLGERSPARRRDRMLSDAGASGNSGFWLVLRWRAWLIAASTLAVVGLAGAVLAVLPPRYKAMTVVLVDPRQPRVTSSEAVISGIGADAAAVESQVELIESSALARKVVDRLKLAEDSEFISPSILERLTEGVLSAFGASRVLTDETRLNQLIYRFKRGLGVRRRGLTYVLEISYSSSDPIKAAAISGAVAEAYLDDQRAAKTEITARASNWLTERIDAMRERVREADRAVADYKSAHGIVDVTQGNKLISRQIEDLTQQLALTRSRSAEARARLDVSEQVSRSSTDPAALVESLQSPVIANLRSQYAETARAEAESRALYGERHPSLVGVRSQLADLRRQISQELARIVAGVRNDYQVAHDREKSLELQLSRLKEQSATATHADVRLHELEREAQATRALFEQFLNRAKETSEQQSLQIPDARIISPALVPIRQDRPPLLVLLLAAATGGVILGIGLVLLWEQLRRGIRSGAEIEELFSLPCIATLPNEQDSPAGGRALFAWGRRRPAAPTHATSASLLALSAPMSTYVRNLQTVRTRLRRSGSARQGEVLVVVSALPGEGKSTFACNFALTAACSGTRTLLIDGDVYNASASEALEVSGPGLWEILRGKASFWSTIVQDSDSMLYVLAARAPSRVPPRIEDIPEAAIANMLRECRKHFDLVVVDSPAILSIVGGCMPFVECADRAVMIVEWERTGREAIAEAIGALATHVRKVAGVVLNKVPMEWYRLFDNGKYLDYYAYSQAAPKGSRRTVTEGNLG